jgi:hypothetical protein
MTLLLLLLLLLLPLTPILFIPNKGHQEPHPQAT